MIKLVEMIKLEFFTSRVPISYENDVCSLRRSFDYLIIQLPGKAHMRTLALALGWSASFQLCRTERISLLSIKHIDWSILTKISPKGQLINIAHEVTVDV